MISVIPKNIEKSSSATKEKKEKKEKIWESLF